MVNHFRTLLVNLSSSELANVGLDYKSANVSIDNGKVDLPQGLLNIYNLLFPTEDIKVKLILCEAYIQLIASTGLHEFVTIKDSRVTSHPSNSSNFFFSGEITKGIPNLAATSPDIDLRVYNLNYSPDELSHDIERLFKIEQVGDTEVINVWEGDTLLIENLALSFSAGFSEPVAVTENVLSPALFEFIIKDAAFTATADKEWTVSLKVPFKLFIEERYKKLQAIKQEIYTTLNKYTSTIDDKYPLQLWNSHFNPLYRLAGLLIAYVYRVDNFIN